MAKMVQINQMSETATGDGGTSTISSAAGKNSRSSERIKANALAIGPPVDVRFGGGRTPFVAELSFGTWPTLPGSIFITVGTESPRRVSGDRRRPRSLAIRSPPK